MTAIARLTRAELRKLTTTRTALITLAIAIALSVISVVVAAANAGQHGTPPWAPTPAPTRCSRSASCPAWP